MTHPFTRLFANARAALQDLRRTAARSFHFTALLSRFFCTALTLGSLSLGIVSIAQAQAPTGIEPGFRFNLRGAGQYYDQESGLIHNNARSYCPFCGGRFTQPDPSGLQAGFNPYEYLRNNPMGFIDPEGLAPRTPYPQAPQPYVVSPTGGGGGMQGRPLVGGSPVQRLDAPVPFCEPGTPGAPPPNMAPEGAGRRGALNAAKRAWGIPMSQSPASVGPNISNQNRKVQGRSYVYEGRDENGKAVPVVIRDDAGGHDFGVKNPQNRGPHFNDPADNHYDY